MTQATMNGKPTAAERALLGVMLRKPNRIGDILKIISPSDFSTHAHQHLAAIISALQSRGVPIDAVTVAKEIHDRGQDADISPSFLADLLDLTDTGANAEYHAGLVYEAAKRRELGYLLARLQRDAESGRDPNSIIEEFKFSVEGLAAQNAFAFRWEPIDSATLAKGASRPAALINRVFFAGQPTITGGAQKTLKTSLGVDAAISLGTGTAFLNEFAVPKIHHVAFMSGESGQYAIELRAKEICAARGIDLADAQVKWQFRLPRVSVSRELDELRRGLERDKIDVVFLDPLYLSLLSGSADISASNLFEMGPLLQRIAAACLDVGATPNLMHHASRPASRKYEPLELADLAFAGLPEFARGWWLLSRREVYTPGTGQHQLYFVAGGSLGYGGLWHLDIDEGRRAEDFQSGGQWELKVESATAARQAEKTDRKRAKSREDEEKWAADESKTMIFIDKLARKDPPEPATMTRLRKLTGLRDGRLDRALDRLADRGLVSERLIQVAGGNGAKQGTKAYVRAKDDDATER